MDTEELRRMLTEASERAQECGEAIRDALVRYGSDGNGTELICAGARNGEVRDALNAAIRILVDEPSQEASHSEDCCHLRSDSFVEDGVRYCGRCGWAWAVVRPGDLR